jgi:hypothetical protein
MDDTMIIDIWDTFKEYIPEKTREAAATHFVDFLLGHDVDNSTLENLLGYDPHLDYSIKIVLDSEDDFDDEFEDDDGMVDDNEDY